MHSDDQKLWKGIYVDKGLRDEWLEAMNGLDCWSVYSTCEGHSDLSKAGAGASTCGRIWLESSPIAHDRLVKHWGEIKGDIESVAQRLFARDTKVEIRCDQDLAAQQESITLYLEHNRPRESEIMDSKTEGWFRDTVSNLVAFDRFTKQAIDHTKERQEPKRPPQYEQQ